MAVESYTITFPTVAGTTDYTVAISDFGWLEKAQIHNATCNPSDYELTLYPLLSSSGSQARPDKITVFSDDNAGNYVFRLMSVPDLVYTVTLTYQKAPIQATTLFGASLGSITSIAAASAGSTVYTASGGFTGGTANGLAGQYLIISSATAQANNGIFYVTASSATTITVNNQNGVLQSGAGGTAQAGTTWAPIPDKYNFLYERFMAAQMHKMYDAATYAMELQIFFKQLVGCSEGLTDTAKAIFLEDRLAQVRTEAATMAATSAYPKRAQ